MVTSPAPCGGDHGGPGRGRGGLRGRLGGPAGLQRPSLPVFQAETTSLTRPPAPAHPRNRGGTSSAPAAFALREKSQPKPKRRLDLNSQGCLSLSVLWGQKVAPAGHLCRDMPQCPVMATARRSVTLDDACDAAAPTARGRGETRWLLSGKDLKAAAAEPRTCTHARTHTHAHARITTNTHVHAQPYTNTHTHMRTHAHTCAHMHNHTHTCT